MQSPALTFNWICDVDPPQTVFNVQESLTGVVAGADNMVGTVAEDPALAGAISAAERLSGSVEEQNVVSGAIQAPANLAGAITCE
jgi:hypothetical protein